MNRPITLCDRCKVFMAGWHGGKEYARCCLNYDGDNCRRSRTVEPTNADRIRSMTDEEMADEILGLFAAFYEVEWSKETLLNLLKQEAEEGKQ